MCPKLKNSYSWFSEEQLIKFGKHKLTGDQLHHWRRISETESSFLYASLNSWFVFIAELIIQVAFVKNFQPNSLIRIRFNYGKFSSWENWQLYTSSIIGKLSELYITSKTTGPEKTENFRIFQPLNEAINFTNVITTWNESSFVFLMDTFREFYVSYNPNKGHHLHNTKKRALTW